MFLDMNFRSGFTESDVFDFLVGKAAEAQPLS